MSSAGPPRRDAARRMSVENPPEIGTTYVDGTVPTKIGSPGLVVLRLRISIGPAGQTPYAVPQPRPPMLITLPCQNGAPLRSRVRADAGPGKANAAASKNVTVAIRP